MTRVEHLLFMLAEECGEVAQRASKAARFGLTEIWPETGMTNAEAITAEMNDLSAVWMLLTKPAINPEATLKLFGDDDSMKRAKAIFTKIGKVEWYLTYANQCGTLTGGTPSGSIRVNEDYLTGLVEFVKAEVVGKVSGQTNIPIPEALEQMNAAMLLANYRHRMSGMTTPKQTETNDGI